MRLSGNKKPDAEGSPSMVQYSVHNVERRICVRDSGDLVATSALTAVGASLDSCE